MAVKDLVYSRGVYVKVPPRQRVYLINQRIHPRTQITKLRGMYVEVLPHGLGVCVTSSTVAQRP